LTNGRERIWSPDEDPPDDGSDGSVSTGAAGDDAPGKPGPTEDEDDAVGATPPASAPAPADAPPAACVEVGLVVAFGGRAHDVTTTPWRRLRAIGDRPLPLRPEAGFTAAVRDTCALALLLRDEVGAE
jgi:hypothetical protein